MQTEKKTPFCYSIDIALMFDSSMYFAVFATEWFIACDWHTDTDEALHFSHKIETTAKT